MKFRTGDAFGFFARKDNNQVVETFGYDNQDELKKLIKHRDSVKKKRIRKKLNTKLDNILGR